jgi:hypothetical protein
MLDEECGLIDPLEICQGGEAEASKGFAAEDDMAAGRAAEAHFWDEGIIRGDGNAVKLFSMERPTGKCGADAFSRYYTSIGGSDEVWGLVTL